MSGTALAIVLAVALTVAAAGYVILERPITPKPAPVAAGDPLISVAIVPIQVGLVAPPIGWQGSTPSRSVAPRLNLQGSRRNVRLSELRSKFPAPTFEVYMNGERVFVRRLSPNSRGEMADGPPIIRREVTALPGGLMSHVDKWNIGTQGSGTAGVVLDAVIIVGTAAATAVGGPGAGVAAGAIGGIIRSKAGI